MILGRRSVSSKVFPAVEIPVCTLLGIKEYLLGHFWMSYPNISFGTVFQRRISQNSWDGDTVNYLLVCYLTIPFLLLKKPDACVCSWYLAEYPIHCVGVTAFV